VIRKVELLDTHQCKSIVSLQREAYQIEADLLGTDAIPPLHDTIASLQASGESFYGFELAGQLAGAIAFKRTGDLLDIHRLMVDPRHFRRGIAHALLEHVLSVEPGIARAIVQTGSNNAPARAFYRSQGFREVGEREVVPGLLVTLFERHFSVQLPFTGSPSSTKTQT
jgi:ribosomal protein S18 acetylase RimI-like enzyme